MFDTFGRDAVIITTIVATAILVVCPLQLLLCFKVKKVFYKLPFTALLAVAATVFSLLMRFSRDWSAIAYAIVWYFFEVQLLFNGIAWAIWAIVRAVRKKKSKILSENK